MAVDVAAIESFRDRVLAGEMLSDDEVMSLAGAEGEAAEAMRRAAAEVTRRFHSRKFDSCSIINARSGRCSEDCKWCAQSAHYPTQVSEYPLVGHDTCMEMAALNRRHGIGRFSFVTSGRAMKGAALDKACEYYAEIHRQGGLYLCASMGLLGDEEMRKLAAAGVRRYHCNMETAPSMFPRLCTTHTREQKLAAIAAARRAGMEICSGGIIGMGETAAQRAEFAVSLREVEPASIPINILIPIPGTPLEHQKGLTDDEILDTVAIFRLAHPRAVLRFAGGRALMSAELQLRAMETGINGAIMGDMLTTLGSGVDEDKDLIARAGMEF
ncbi:MAG: biotin synthase BioB [Duncaniella sp.]|nr:biotin synthase BioB [Duncaniella sp.]